MSDTLADTFTVGWTAMADGTREDYEQLSRIFEGHAQETLVPHLLSVMRLLEGPTLGYQIDRARHCRQSATRALRNGESSEFVVAALLHDIGDVLAPDNHSAVAAAIVAPYVSEETEWVVRHHGLFQGYYYFHHLGGDRHARERYTQSRRTTTGASTSARRTTRTASTPTTTTFRWRTSSRCWKRSSPGRPNTRPDRLSQPGPERPLSAANKSGYQAPKVRGCR